MVDLLAGIDCFYFAKEVIVTGVDSSMLIVDFIIAVGGAGG